MLEPVAQDVRAHGQEDLSVFVGAVVVGGYGLGKLCLEGAVEPADERGLEVGSDQGDQGHDDGAVDRRSGCDVVGMNGRLDSTPEGVEADTSTGPGGVPELDDHACHLEDELDEDLPDVPGAPKLPAKVGHQIAQSLPDAVPEPTRTSLGDLGLRISGDLDVSF